jgi:hypothetical protein
MRRKTPLMTEQLEGRTLLSSLFYTLTANQAVYQAGQTIQITFIETNTSNIPVTVEVSPTDFTVSQNGNAIWQSNPGNESQPPSAETLKPGQSVTQTATWNGTITSGGGLATYQINQFGTFSVTNPNGPQGLNASFQISDPITNSLTTNHSVYQLGEPVEVTYTEVNTASVPVTIDSPPPEEFLIFQNGTPLWWIAYPQIVLGSPTTLQAGRTITYSQTFNIIPQSGPYTLDNLTGTFVAGFGPENDPTLFSTSFQVDPPSPDDLVTSVTTNQATYPLGQTVNLTFSETNNGDQPIVVLTGATQFQISQNGTPIWDSNPLPAPAPTWTTLQPGQSYSQTASWNGVPNVGTLGSLSGAFIVVNELDPNGDTAAFQFAAPSSQLTTSLTANQAVYQLGELIQLNFTETNTGSSPIQVLTGPPSFDITQNGAIVWTSSEPSNSVTLPSYSWTTLQPGQSVTQTAMWNGVPGELPSGFSNGTFTVTNALDPRAESTTFTIIASPPADLSTSVTTDKSVYDFGQPIQLTLTETNVGSQPIVVLTSGANAFEITHDGSDLWDSTSPSTLAANSTWEILQPGQSYVQTLSWNGPTWYVSTSPEATGTFIASNLLDPNGSTATFQIVGPVSVPPNIPVPQPVIATLISNQNAYKPGQSVRLTMTLNNTSTAKVSVTPNTFADGITVMDGSTVVFRSRRTHIAAALRSIKPHHSVKLALAWSGRPNQKGVAKLAPGTYTVLVVDGGYAGTTTVQIVR